MIDKEARWSSYFTWTILQLLIRLGHFATDCQRKRGSIEGGIQQHAGIKKTRKMGCWIIICYVRRYVVQRRRGWDSING